MVYALNTPTQRKSLWNYLGDQHANGNQDSWVVLGDFNATLSLADRHGGDGNCAAVHSAWETEAIGNPISRLTSKLRALKRPLSKLHKNHTNNISSRVERAKEDWQRVQLNMERNTSDASLGQRERDACRFYNALRQAEETFYKQRSRIQWLQLGDKNTAFFHRTLLHRHHRNSIHNLRNENARYYGANCRFIPEDHLTRRG
ncbi:hypothetical protein OIU84_016926 [Salix udensis]|uniref:Endonuclease/exonuclease/phosphatase domain-containing protein n=1 Tax=Salix udensis TaxID=889485 RepID=A0AAD6JCK0_9ROSI|nr:hypothetical protein OIU84_016926 [Salix udensis]